MEFLERCGIVGDPAFPAEERSGRKAKSGSRKDAKTQKRAFPHDFILASLRLCARKAFLHAAAAINKIGSMEDWVLRSLARWPNVPALYGWLGLDRRGRWLIRGEPISRPQIIDTINRNYAADEHGRWYFQNGPQRGYMQLEYAPLVLRAEGEGDALLAHTEARIGQVSAAYLDEQGALLLATDRGPGVLDAADLDWALRRLLSDSGEVDETQLAAALALPSGSATALRLRLAGEVLPLRRLDAAQAPQQLGFVREPQPPG